MEIVIIGTGNTATVLGKMLKRAGHRIVQVFGRNSTDASKLAYHLGTESTNYWNVVKRNADIYLVAVSDVAIGEILTELQLPQGTLVHTAASVSKEVFKPVASKYGVFYPLQSLQKDSDRLPEVPIIIDASDPATLNQLDTLAHSISGQVVLANDDERGRLHLAAVFCNNFVNHLYALAEKYCRNEGLEFSLLLPLIRETADRLAQIDPARAQTGQAVRHDEATIERHLELLKRYPELAEFYRLFTVSIEKMYG
jgi:predicted short-subunit dehydrogenase-like oxidoreductase (DUF2520 family)